MTKPIETVVPADPNVSSWQATWRALRPNATYNHDFGFERSWRGQYTAWGYPMEDVEFPVLVNGKTYQARNFTKVGLVYWDPATGAQTYARTV